MDENGDLLKEGGTMYRRKLAQTMRTLAAEGAAAFYNGSMAATIVAEIAERGKNQYCFLGRGGGWGGGGGGGRLTTPPNRNQSLGGIVPNICILSSHQILFVHF